MKIFILSSSLALEVGKHLRWPIGRQINGAHSISLLFIAPWGTIFLCNFSLISFLLSLFPFNKNFSLFSPLNFLACLVSCEWAKWKLLRLSISDDITSNYLIYLFGVQHSLVYATKYSCQSQQKAYYSITQLSLCDRKERSCNFKHSLMYGNKDTDSAGGAKQHSWCAFNVLRTCHFPVVTSVIYLKEQ